MERHLMGNGSDIEKSIRETGNRIEAVLKDLFPRKDTDDFLTEAFYYHMDAGGKRIRPALCLLTCEGLGGDASEAVHFAAAVEVLHNMFLIHDDIEDGDEVRRDAPAVWVKYGPANAINLGDYMLGRACSSILNSPVGDTTRCRLLDVFVRTYENTCRGQALDLNWRGAAGMNVEKYMEMVRLKTGDYLVLGMIGGAITAGASEAVVESLRLLGNCMGPAFQIRDDVIDLTRGKGRGGELGNDIREGKPSILYAHALNAAAGEDRDFLIAVTRRERKETDNASVRKVIELYEKYGSIKFANDTADALTRKACDAVEDIPVDNKELFRRLVRFMTDRTK